MNNSSVAPLSSDFSSESKSSETQTKISKKKLVLNALKKQTKQNKLFLATISAVIIGISLAFILRASVNLTKIEREYFGFPGEIFIRMLKALILPLMISSLVIGIARLDTSRAGKIALRAIIYYLSTTICATIIGLVLVLSIQPGKRSELQSNSIDATFQEEKVTILNTMLDIIRNLFPDNLIEMMFLQYKTVLIAKNRTITNLTLVNESNVTADKIVTDWIPNGTTKSGINILGLVMFCIIFGIMLGQMKENGEILVKFFEALNMASVKMINLVMIISPIGICSLICGTVLTMDDPETMFKNVSFLVLTSLLGLFIHGFVMLPLAYYIFTRKNVFKFAANMFEALLVAFTTSSSAATLPVTFRCVEDKNKISKSISRFILPIGATINMDGGALFEAIAAIFIVQLNGLNYNFGQIVLTSITATLVSIGAPGVPNAGLFTTILVINALNLPFSGISLIYAIDWFLDRFRTVVNVWGDMIGTGIVAHLSRNEIAQLEELDKRKTNGDAHISMDNDETVF